jgi:anaerobic selenocysteine-containing dehydrogenase
MKKTDTDTGLSRRDFLKTSGAIAAGLGLGLMLPKGSPLFGQSISEGSTPAQTAGVLNHLAAVRNGEPHTMFDKGIEALAVWVDLFQGVM